MIRRGCALAVFALLVLCGTARASEQSFDRDWKFVLVNQTGITDPDRGLRQRGVPGL